MSSEKYETLIPDDSVVPDDGLIRDLIRHGAVYPLILCEGVVVDGIKRMNVLSDGKSSLATVELVGNPYLWRWLLNRSRPWNLLETALVYMNMPEDLREDYCSDRQLGKSPFTGKALEYAALTKRHRNVLRDGHFTLAVLRDLAVGPEKMEEWIDTFLSCPGTAGEKRTAARLIKTCLQRGIDVDPSGYSSMADLIDQLDRASRPAQHAFQNRFKDTVKKLSFPRNAKLTMDESLEKEGILLNISLKRKNLDTLDQVSEKLRKLLEMLEFL